MTRLTLAAVLVGTLAVGVAAQTRPDPDVTPGATNPAITQATINQTICRKGWSTKSIRPPASFTTALKKRQLAERHDTVANPLPRVKTASGTGTRPDLTKCVARSANPSCWEEDHLISLELGGAPKDPANLWPEPWAGRNNAHDKDRLENTLHRLVCEGTLTLREAQAAIATDWIAAYAQYVQP